MSIATLTATEFGGAPDAPVLILGPSLGTSAATLWTIAAQRLSTRFRVIGWDLPGHGHTRTAEPFTMADLAAAVLRLADDFSPHQRVHYAGDSVGGCVGLQLMIDAGDRVATATLLSTGASIATPQGWHDRAEVVRVSGTESMVNGSAQRWFGPSFADREPTVANALFDALRSTEAEGYAQVCEALAAFDVTDRLGEITTPVLCIAGADDAPTPPESLHRIASGVKDGRVVVLPGVGHLPPAEAPHQVADLIAGHAAPDANSAFRIAPEVLAADDSDRRTP